MGVVFLGGPDRIYDQEVAAEPLPPKHPLGFHPPEKPKQEKEPDLWEGDNA